MEAEYYSIFRNSPRGAGPLLAFENDPGVDDPPPDLSLDNERVVTSS
jgi:hypothetical protein